MEEDLAGIIYALPLEIATNIFQKGKDVFVKYIPHEPTRKTELKLKKGMKLYIYLSKSNKSVIGEARIKKVHYMNVDEIIKNFRDRIMFSVPQLLLYAKERENKKAQVIELENSLLYRKELSVKIPMTMSGFYVKSNRFKEIFGDKNG